MAPEETPVEQEQGSQDQSSETPIIKPVQPKTDPVPPTPAPDVVKEIDILFELDRRGFRSKDEALRLIKRYDEAVKQAELSEMQLEQRRNEIRSIEIRFVAREAELEKKAKAMLDARSAQESRLRQINERIALLSKLES